ncbi:Hypothetical protein D9617_23g005970 [Elsinoe fawcettii]|nr:Hypothetical protein D9617_23g005970 [Elsinoe fawcettii]
MGDITFTSREIAVMAAVYGIVDIPTLSAEQWKSVAATTGITNGDVGRNAKFAFTNAMKKIGSKGGDGAKAGKGETGKAKGGKGRKRKAESEEEVVKDEDESADAGDEEGEVNKDGAAKKGRVVPKKLKKEE